ncbi:MAG: sulfite exporter TauE/SafE family protein [Acidobacteriota bacterium]|nr:sulfite exporter TauE/SafE family protein [Blastocatellia bacterium]MDW8239108.1 sulfite exporter TauE/SafE family protein [Acidobacteriota bacterium]
MTLLEFYLIFSFGLLSSLHCVQMCGPIVLSYSLPLGSHATGNSRRRRANVLVAHLSYNLGRIVTYMTLGAVGGLTGGTIGLIGQLAGIENVVAIIVGGLMVLTGLVMLDLMPLTAIQRFDPLRFTMRLFRPLNCQIASPTVASKFRLGLMLGFLPCGLVYAALLKAIASATPLGGALTMFAFGLGTVGALLAVGLCSSAFSLKLGRWGTRLAAVSVTLLGAFLIWRGVMAAPLLGHGDAPCCHH